MTPKRALWTAAALLLACVPSVQADPFDHFRDRAADELLKPFARDLGGLLGAAGLHPGRPLGFPGFEAGIMGAAQFRPNSDNRIFRDAGVKSFGLPMVHAGVGLPFKVDLMAHGMSAQGLKVGGAGVRYGLFKSGLLTKFMPSVGVSAFYDKVDHDAFSADHYAFNASASWDLPIVAPFLGAGVDSTKVKVESSPVPGVTGLSKTATGSRFALGADLTPFPFMRLRGAYQLINKNPGAMAALLVKF